MHVSVIFGTDIIPVTDTDISANVTIHTVYDRLLIEVLNMYYKHH
jgi:hypothetical protein